MTNNDTTAALRECEDLPETIYCWRHGDDEPINGMWLECNDSANPGVKYVREHAEREAFAHRYNTVVYEIWNDGWKQGYEQGKQSTLLTHLEQATPAEAVSLKDVARLVYGWHKIERDDLSIVEYDELSNSLKEILRNHARAVLTAAKAKWRE